MKGKAAYLFYIASYLFKTKVLRQDIPFIGGLVVNEKCNLRCKQCALSNRNIPDLTYKEIELGLQILYKKDIRAVFIEGGEPFLWRDGKFKLEDVIRLARTIGFHLVTVYTNGTIPLHISADLIFVSLDGLKETTNDLRGNGKNIYDKIVKNIRASDHPNIIINYTINSINQNDLEPFCEEMRKISQVKGTFFNFHTPYFGFDKLFLDLEKRRKKIKEILSLKSKGYKIFNSTACLNGVFRDNWVRPSKICYIYANNKTYQCCRAADNKDACKNCGYLGYPEIIFILKLRPSAIFSAINYLPKKWS